MIHQLIFKRKITFSIKHLETDIKLETNLMNICITGNKIIFSDRYQLNITKLDEPVPFTALIPVKFFNNAMKNFDKKIMVILSFDTDAKTCSYKDNRLNATISTELKYIETDLSLPLPEPFKSVKEIFKNIKKESDECKTIAFDAEILYNLMLSLKQNPFNTIALKFNPDAPNKPIIVEKMSNDNIDTIGVLMPVRYNDKNTVDEMINKVFGNVD